MGSRTSRFTFLGLLIIHLQDEGMEPYSRKSIPEMSTPQGLEPQPHKSQINLPQSTSKLPMTWIQAQEKRRWRPVCGTGPRGEFHAPLASDVQKGNTAVTRHINTSKSQTHLCRGYDLAWTPPEPEHPRVEPEAHFLCRSCTFKLENPASLAS
ncbi:unnamed protein product [Rangifer tarandus platyrhynchus]|uniref:Uncharacterized protein n=1 Tax=Rangifer tarandus platyrhynchus TaxID=3082113 RepID=A0AC60A934_RANTA